MTDHSFIHIENKLKVFPWYFQLCNCILNDICNSMTVVTFLNRLKRQDEIELLTVICF